MNPSHHPMTIGPVPIGMVAPGGPVTGGPVGIAGIPILTTPNLATRSQVVIPTANNISSGMKTSLISSTTSGNSQPGCGGVQNTWGSPIIPQMTGMGYSMLGMNVPMGAQTVSSGALPAAASVGGGQGLHQTANTSLLNEAEIRYGMLNGKRDVNQSHGPVVSATSSSQTASSQSKGTGSSGNGNQVMKEIIHCKSCTLFPPNPSAPPPTKREKPLGCRTVFVGGLPENATEEIVREIFERCGEITTVRMSKKNFCHIRFEVESYVENAIYLSGYRVRIGSNTELPNLGRLHVDYAQARDDQYEYECRQRQLLREQRHRERLEQERLLPPSPPPVVHYSDHEALNMTEKLKGDESFMKGVQVLITWLERGDCSKKNSNTFYSMIQSTNSHVRRLLNEKSQYEEELLKAKELMTQRMQGLLMQFGQIEKVFLSATHKKVWDHFTKAQRKNIEMWKKQALEIKGMQLEDALRLRREEEMDLSDCEEADSDKDTVPRKRLRLQQDCAVSASTIDKLKEENDSLLSQLEALKNAVDQIKADFKSELEMKDQTIQKLEQCGHCFQQSKVEDSFCVNGNGKLTATVSSSTSPTIGNSPAYDPNKIEPNCDSSSNGQSHNNSPNNNNNNLNNGNIRINNFNDQPSIMQSNSGNRIDHLSISSRRFNGNNGINSLELNSPSSPSENILKISGTEARLIGIISTFLHVHPFGASVEYIWSYVQKISPTVTHEQLARLLQRVPMLFSQQVSGVGATLERKWKFAAFT